MDEFYEFHKFIRKLLYKRTRFYFQTFTTTLSKIETGHSYFTY